MKIIRICHLYGNLLNTYGDNGNLLMLQYYAKKRGNQVETTLVSLNDPFQATDYDLVFFGGGQDYEQKIIAQDIPRLKTEITAFIEQDGVMLAICGGYQLLGQYYVSSAGDKIIGLGVLPHYTERQINSRFTGDIEIYDATLQQTYYGFENHNGVTYLPAGLEPLGKVVTGHGNNGQDQTEGLHYRNLYCSYFHGPLLVRNEWLAQHLIELTISRQLSHQS